MLLRVVKRDHNILGLSPPTAYSEARQEHNFSGYDWLSCHYALVSCQCSLTFPLPLRFSWNSAWKDCFCTISFRNHCSFERREARDLDSLSYIFATLVSPSIPPERVLLGSINVFRLCCRWIATGGGGQEESGKGFNGGGGRCYVFFCKNRS